MLLSQALNTSAMKNPSAAAILDLGKATSYGEWKKRVGQLSFLYQAEIGHNNKVAFLSHNTPHVLLTFFALSNTGNISFFVDPVEKDEDIAKWFRDLEITHIAVGSTEIARANELIRNFGLNVQVIEIEKKKGGEYDPTYSPPPDQPLKETNPVLILRKEEFREPTKYIFFNHHQIYMAATAIRRFYHLTANDRILTTMNWAHPYALIHSVFLPLFYGATIAIDPQSPSHEEFVEYIATNRITRFVDTPKFYFLLLAICKNAKYLLPGVKSITVGMGTLSQSLRKTYSLLKVPVIHTFGAVETLWSYAMEDTERLVEDRIQAYALPGVKYKVLNEAGDEIPGPERREGPFALMGEFVMDKFFHPDKKLAEKATRHTMRGTWFYTGWIARLEGEDDTYQVQPLSHQENCIRINGAYYHADRIDAALQELTEIVECAGFVHEDTQGVQSFACAIIPRGKALSEIDVIEFCRAKLNENEMPKRIFFTDELPKDEFDQVNRGALRRQYAGG